MAGFQSGDVCACAHSGAYHDPTSGLCRFAGDPNPTVNCGCQGFAFAGQTPQGALLTNDQGPVAPGDPNVVGNDDR